MHAAKFNVVLKTLIYYYFCFLILTRLEKRSQHINILPDLPWLSGRAWVALIQHKFPSQTQVILFSDFPTRGNLTQHVHLCRLVLLLPSVFLAILFHIRFYFLLARQ